MSACEVEQVNAEARERSARIQLLLETIAALRQELRTFIVGRLPDEDGMPVTPETIAALWQECRALLVENEDRLAALERKAAR